MANEPKRFRTVTVQENAVNGTLEQFAKDGYALRGIHQTHNGMLIVGENKTDSRKWETIRVRADQMQETLNKCASRGQNVKAITPCGKDEFQLAVYTFHEALQTA